MQGSLEMGNYVYFTSLTDYYHRTTLNRNRQNRLPALAKSEMSRTDHLLENNTLIMILSTLFIQVIQHIYLRNLNHVPAFPWANRLADCCNFTLRLGNKE